MWRQSVNSNRQSLSESNEGLLSLSLCLLIILLLPNSRSMALRLAAQANAAVGKH